MGAKGVRGGLFITRERVEGTIRVETEVASAMKLGGTVSWSYCSIKGGDWVEDEWRRLGAKLIEEKRSPMVEFCLQTGAREGE